MDTTSLSPTQHPGRALGARRRQIATELAGVLARMAVASAASLAVLAVTVTDPHLLLATSAVLGIAGTLLVTRGGATRGLSSFGSRLTALWPSVLLLGLALIWASDRVRMEITVPEALITAAVAVAGAWLTGLALARVTNSTQRIIVVGSGEVAAHVVRSLAAKGGRSRVVGIVDRAPREEDGPRTGAPYLGDLDLLPALIAEHGVATVVYTFLETRDHELLASVAACRAAGAEVQVVSRLFQGLGGELAVRRINGLPLISAYARRDRRAAAAAKRLTDLVLACALLVVALPVWAALAAAIKLESPGEVLYRASRVGRDGVPFAMLKFRKMYKDASGIALTAADDERFTRIGRFLAHSKLDELPQLWNVLRGEMSLVGPRPEDARYVAAHPDAFRYVLSGRPGITGLAQIRYRKEFEHLVGGNPEEHYIRTLLPDKLAVDSYYVGHQTWWLDIRILFWTTLAVLRGGELELSELASHVSFSRGRVDELTPEAVIGS
jgi:exopolysaccharide biosynthesis polyprenyl glycosylphosphotransferase